MAEVVQSEIRSGAYADSIVLMQLQSALTRLPGVIDAGVVMGTPVNLDLLASNDLLLNAPLTRFGGTVSGVGLLFTDADGTTYIGADISGDGCHADFHRFEYRPGE